MTFQSSILLVEYIRKNHLIVLEPFLEAEMRPTERVVVVRKF